MTQRSLGHWLQPRCSGPDEIPVWDLLVRLFHWSLVLAFFTAWLTEEDILVLHVPSGYAVGGLVVFRFLWGFVGTPHARWSDFVRPPGEIAAYLRALLRGRAPRFVGHNPAGGAMIVALLVALAVTVLTGLVAYGSGEGAGPLAGLAAWPDGVAHLFEEIHEAMASFTLFLVGLHVAGVALSSLLHRENLVRAMITGCKRRETS